MNMKKLFIAALMTMSAVVTTPVMAQSFDSPITQAMMSVYNTIIEEDPRDYETLIRRGNEYYNHNMYRQALDDVNNALRYIPKDDNDTRLRALLLRSNVYSLSKRHSEAVKDLDEVLTMDPMNYVALYLRGNALFELGQYDRAQTDYANMLRVNPRSQDGMFGIAKVAVKQQNIGVANDYANRAVELTPAVSDVYMRRAEVRRLAGDNTGAVDDYLLAISTDQVNTPHALQELVKMSNTHYSVVMSGLSNAISRAPRNGMFYYIRAMIAQGHCNYSAAIADYDKILNDKMYVYAGLNASLAECYYALGKYDIALLNVDYAISASPEDASYNVLKSSILRATGDADGALEQAEIALEKSPDSTPALQAKSLAFESKGDYQQASVTLSEAILNSPTDPYLLMLRGWILKDYRKQADVAKTCYERVLDLEFDIDDVRSFKGFALMYLGRVDEGEKWLKNILASVDDTDGLINYYAACFYAQKGDKAAALTHVENSLKRGYANYHNWMEDNDARINVAPLRKESGFKALMDKYALLFK